MRTHSVRLLLEIRCAAAAATEERGSGRRQSSTGDGERGNVKNTRTSQRGGKKCVLFSAGFSNCPTFLVRFSCVFPNDLWDHPLYENNEPHLLVFPQRSAPLLRHTTPIVKGWIGGRRRRRGVSIGQQGVDGRGGGGR